MTVNPDYVHLFIKYPPKDAVYYVANVIKGRSSRIHIKDIPPLKEWCGAPSCYHNPVGNGWDVAEKYISAPIHMNIIKNYDERAIIRPCTSVLAIAYI